MSLAQHTPVATRWTSSSHTMNTEQFNEQLISNVAVQSVYFSDHHLLTCCLRVPLPQAVTATFTYRRINTKAFCLDILQSRLFGELDLDADGLFDAECWTSMCHYGQVVIAAASMTAATCLTKRDKPSNYVGDWNGSTVVQACSQTNRPINQLVRLHRKASAGHDPITSRHNSTKHPVTSVPPVQHREQHRGCCTADRRSCTTTISALSLSRRSASSSPTRSDASATTS